ncbi:MAG: ABC transporter ATP-binding protein [Sphaerochaetaceae bacterium]|nr:ABC transporter ATP-binding protein [Sphaerochaetaceae bacterium]
MSEPYLVLNNIKASYPEFNLELNISVNKGELVSIIGPSGSGKSTTLSIISGLLKPDSGSITINGNDITSLSPDKRKVGLVFQDYALFPHMNVEQNIAYPMKNAGIPKEKKKQEVQRLLELVNLSGYEKRTIDQLSGGEKQRVALARALASNPDILLLDEPLSALDAKLRQSLRNDIREIQKKTGTTTVYVTHDQEEALSLSDHIVVLNKGSIEQIGTPEEIYRNPATEFTAVFTGDCNLLPYDIILKTLRVPETEKSRIIYQCHGPNHKLFFRPEDMVANDIPSLPFPEFFPHLRFENATIIRMEYIGREYLITANYDGHYIKAYTKYKPENDHITLGIRMSKILEFNEGNLLK